MQSLRLMVAPGLLVVAVLLGRILWRSVPFDPASYAAWGGILVAFLALISLARPVPWLGTGTRGRAALGLCFGVAVTAIAVSWPSPIQRPSGPKHRIDDFLPEYQFTELHEARTRAPLPRVLEAIQRVSWGEMPAARFLLRLRAIAGGTSQLISADSGPVFETMLRSGRFMALDLSNPAELVMGMTGGPGCSGLRPRPRTPQEFQAFTVPGIVRVAFDMRAVDEGDGVVRISTETRILASDPAMRRIFARYWRLVYPGSAIIRRAWLDAIVARAEGDPDASLRGSSPAARE